MLNSASRDDREFQNPDEFVWNREIPRVLSFGMGQHHCIGKHLAVMEIRIMVREFLERVRDVEFHPEQGGHRVDDVRDETVRGTERHAGHLLQDFAEPSALGFHATLKPFAE